MPGPSFEDELGVTMTPLTLEDMFPEHMKFQYLPDDVKARIFARRRRGVTTPLAGMYGIDEEKLKDEMTRIKSLTRLTAPLVDNEHSFQLAV